MVNLKIQLIKLFEQKTGKKSFEKLNEHNVNLALSMFDLDLRLTLYVSGYGDDGESIELHDIEGKDAQLFSMEDFKGMDWEPLDKLITFDYVNDEGGYAYIFWDFKDLTLQIDGTQYYREEVQVQDDTFNFNEL